MLGEKNEENDIKTVSGHKPMSSLGNYRSHNLFMTSTQRIRDQKKKQCRLIDISKELVLAQSELNRENVNVHISDGFADVCGDQGILSNLL